MGDTVAAWDQSRRLLSRFDPEGRFVSGVLMVTEDGYPQPIGIWKTGEMVALLNRPSTMELGPPGTIFRDPASYGRFNRDGSFGGIIATVPGFERFTRETRGRLSTGRRPFGYWIFGTVGSRALYYGPGEVFEVSVFDPSGRIEMLVRRSERERDLGPEDIEAYKEALMEDAPGDPNARQEWLRMVDEAPYPKTYPALQRLLIDEEENLWVQEYERPREESVTWSVFDPGGEWITDVQTPRDLRLLKVGGDYVLGLFTDGLGVESVRVYDLQKPPG